MENQENTKINVGLVNTEQKQNEKIMNQFVEEIAEGHEFSKESQELNREAIEGKLRNNELLKNLKKTNINPFKPRR